MEKVKKQPRIEVIETAPGVYSITDRETAMFVNAYPDMDIASFARMMSRLDLDPVQASFLMAFVAAGGAPMLAVEEYLDFNLHITPLVPDGVNVTHGDVGHG